MKRRVLLMFSILIGGFLVFAYANTTDDYQRLSLWRKVIQ